MALYSERHNRVRGFTYSDLAEQIWERRQDLYQQGLLDEKFGYDVASWFTESDPKRPETKYIPGQIEDSRQYFTHQLRYRVDFYYSHSGFRSDTEYQIVPYSLKGDEDKLLDFLELLWQDVSLPKRRNDRIRHIGYDKTRGQKLLQEWFNEDLLLLEKPMILMDNGQIVSATNNALVELSNTALGLSDDESSLRRYTIEPIQEGVQQYMARGANEADKKAAIKSLVDALESIRPLVKKTLLSEDENALFNIANNFAIRHNGKNQRRDYDKSVWYDWVFHVNLAALMTIINIVKQQDKKEK